ncbi:hypothetical protein GGI64_003360 [Rhizobium leguminosarum]|uniref:Uncharacterized protein n=3 Tax=Rhizobium leguminosarum TaxID=384 RepID=A0A7Z0DZL6_RHILE|nr:MULTISPECIES: hypothetical protein [Rhizobium]ACI57082.1 hypothetical protein Rleg2_3820 [Rhizobium leguminosarum bv. trifolii WSM2304]EJB05033.1 hypothetical protein Rleg9DRAFT_3897 [Rhizobium leguminosarum bv. trifolii WSM597]MBB3644709.1 hypothetical protein [Rhizobium sp. BK619]MBB5664283.1 hypothetical protein [Rhizobium leguminosarum]MBB6223874.1 hypothetical protein [Rhizobium leguminosarum]
MGQIFLNSAVAILIGLAFLTTAISALRGEDRSPQRVPVKIPPRRHQKAGDRS